MAIKLQNAIHRKEQKDKPKLNTGPGMTEQAHKRETDMNYILREYTKTGLIKHAKNYQGQYDDVSVQSFQEAMFLVKNAERMFSELPSEARKRFANNPEQFLEFVQNPDNKSEMQRMGILKGNDGIDVSGASVNVPRETPVTTETPPAE